MATTIPRSVIAPSDQRVTFYLGLILFAFGAYLLFLSEGHGHRLPWPLSGLMPY